RQTSKTRASAPRFWISPRCSASPSWSTASYRHRAPLSSWPPLSVAGSMRRSWLARRPSVRPPRKRSAALKRRRSARLRPRLPRTRRRRLPLLPVALQRRVPRVPLPPLRVLLVVPRPLLLLRPPQVLLPHLLRAPRPPQRRQALRPHRRHRVLQQLRALPP